MTFKPGQKVTYQGSEIESVVEFANEWQVRSYSREENHTFEGGPECFRHVFEYEQLVIEMPENEYYGSSTDIYRDKRTGLAVLDKQAYETWITENGL